jgi:myo-inositol 2-dehydrogenase/D-chiro-inositol 1-dehydrogenase
MKNFAIFGAGRIGRIHAANIAAHGAARLKYVVDLDAEAAGRIAHMGGAAGRETRPKRSRIPLSTRC